MRIAAGGFQHETNTFAPSKADYAAFEQADSWPGLTRGPAMLDGFAGMNIPIAGFLDRAKQLGHTIVPLLWCNATPSAQVTDDAFERISAMMLEDLESALRAGIDAVYFDLHGAMVTESLEDGEGELLARIRGLIGPALPLVVSLDLHANVTRRMVELTDALIAYRTYPHVDMAETGGRAADHLDRIGKGLPAQAKAFRKLDFLIPLTASCTLIEPAAGIYRAVAELDGAVLDNGRVNSLSFATGFSPADIDECGPSVLAYADTQAAADLAVDRLAHLVSDSESAFAQKLWSPEEAVRYAMAQPGTRPIILADTQDNPGAGGNGDTVGLLRALIDADARQAIAGVIFDPQSAARAVAAGVGNPVELDLGAKSGGAPEAPVSAVFEVVAVSDGQVRATGPFYGGSLLSLGPTALIRIGGVQVVVASRKVQCADRQMMAHLGVDLSRQKIIAVKSSVHFRADFEPIAAEVLVVAAPGPNPANHLDLPFRHLRRGVRLMPCGPAFGG